MSVSQDPEPSGHTSGPVDDGRGLWTAGRRNLTAGLVLTVTLVAFEALAVSTIMPIVARELGNLELYGWVFTSFMLGSLIGIVVVGGIIDRRGLGLPFAVGIALFAVGLIIGGLAPSMEVLVAGRFLQGLGAGTVPPIAYVAIGRSLPERLRPQMFATLSTAWVLPGVLGPALAGAVGESIGWRWVFLGLLPLIAIAAGIAYPQVRRVGPGAPSAAAATLRERLPLALVVAVGTGLLLGGLTSGDPVLLVVLGTIGAALAILALRQLTPPGTLRAARGMPAAVLIRGIITFAFFAVDAYIALALVEWRGLSATAAGISLTAATLTWTTGSWIQARLSTRYPPERFVQAGIAVLIAGLTTFLVVLYPQFSPWLAIPTVGLAGLGMGLAYSPLALIVLREASGAEQGRASSALSLTDSLGTALGTGITGAAVAAAVRDAGTPFRGLFVGFLVAIAVATLGLILSSRLRVAERPATAAGAVPVTGP
ncbi:MAG: arabinose efflux permease family protein [Chloroflexota bacterium]|jgi:MFS family permease|nr:arabinose efflux permease family protein [Chloroflexota bacterium]